MILKQKGRNKDGRGWRRLKWIGNGDFNQFFSKCTNDDVAPLSTNYMTCLHTCITYFPECHQIWLQQLIFLGKASEVNL